MTATFIVNKTGNTALGKAYRDKVVDPGTAFVYDLGKAFSYPTAGAPTNGAVIKDLDFTANDASFVGSGTLPTYAGGGLDFTSASDATQVIQTPTNVLAGINASKYWAFLAYVKMPSDSDFGSMTLNANNNIFLGTSGAAINVSGGLFHIGWQLAGSTTRRVYFWRGLTGSTFEAVTIDDAAGASAFVGTVVQILYAYLPDGSVIARLKNAASSKSSTRAAGQATNSADISGKYLSSGLVETNRAAGTAKKFRLYRQGLVDLTVAGALLDPPAGVTALVNPGTVATVDVTAWADRDWARNGARFT